ncbi:uncharacterized protein LOC115998406 isoform X2 [Ipomoea triloba]|uniref:uncharacterized protein LOC115998406 isoform X2 n=1 Tax=Ipomoea triloba TaxID=35885 RepID=UPI00125DE580|nr:uncharacterized protein LOC115998406 isoform X2 [Ipomoea triloba]
MQTRKIERGSSGKVMATNEEMSESQRRAKLEVDWKDVTQLEFDEMYVYLKKIQKRVDDLNAMVEKMCHDVKEDNKFLEHLITMLSDLITILRKNVK